ncbi:hypothetical protein EDB86DRAFT_1401956 [Lactarius hatsudake]|nr:hypothetical protein EDB86DRAFT_1401956 [Lactarius hatsudake]
MAVCRTFGTVDGSERPTHPLKTTDTESEHHIPLSYVLTFFLEGASTAVLTLCSIHIYPRFSFSHRHIFRIVGTSRRHLEFHRTAGRVRLSCPLMLFFHIIGLSQRSSVLGHCMEWTCLVRERCCSNYAICVCTVIGPIVAVLQIGSALTRVNHSWDHWLCSVS